MTCFLVVHTTSNKNRGYKSICHVLHTQHIIKYFQHTVVTDIIHMTNKEIVQRLITLYKTKAIILIHVFLIIQQLHIQL